MGVVSHSLRREQAPPVLIGLIGGVAAGKSTVADELVRLGAGRLDADRAGHEALRDPQVVAAARQRWGGAILGADQDIDRKALAQIVFGSAEQAQNERQYLESLTHPLIGQQLAQQLAEMTAAGVRIVVVDAPLLLKSGWDQMCSKIIFIEADHSVRLARAIERGWTADDFAAREAAQEDLTTKREAADFVIDNSGSLASTREQVERLWPQLST